MINDEKGDFRCMEVDVMMKEKDGSLQFQENWSVAVNMVNQNYCQ